MAAEKVRIKHPNVKSTGLVTRHSFEGYWKGKGWKLDNAPSSTTSPSTKSSFPTTTKK